MHQESHRQKVNRHPNPFLQSLHRTIQTIDSREGMEALKGALETEDTNTIQAFVRNLRRITKNSQIRTAFNATGDANSLELAFEAACQNPWDGGKISKENQAFFEEDGRTLKPKVKETLQLIASIANEAQPPQRSR